jgi:hypothetical protein
MVFSEIIAAYSENLKKPIYTAFNIKAVGLCSTQCLKRVAVLKTFKYHACLPVGDYSLHTTYIDHH